MGENELSKDVASIFLNSDSILFLKLKHLCISRTHPGTLWKSRSRGWAEDVVEW